MVEGEFAQVNLLYCSRHAFPGVSAAFFSVASDSSASLAAWGEAEEVVSKTLGTGIGLVAFRKIEVMLDGGLALAFGVAT